MGMCDQSSSRLSQSGRAIALIFCLLWPAAVLAHGIHEGPGPLIHPANLTGLPAPWVNIAIEADQRVIQSNGIPNHAVGSFPNSGNPNRISAQDYDFKVPARPRLTGLDKNFGLGKFGVAINGIPFDPGAAEWWQRNPRSGWQYAAMSGAVPLGLDQNNAHVQPGGAYHYHGPPTGLLNKYPYRQQPTLIGWAGDGFPIYATYGFRDPNDGASGIEQLRSSYRIKSGTRPGGPGGRYDGSFLQDYEYVAGQGDLDECNGRQGVLPEFPNGTYYYVVTEEFPYIPRCFKGTPAQAFLGPQGPPGGQMGGPGQGGFRPPPGQGRPPQGMGGRQGFPPPPGARRGFPAPPPGFPPPN